MGQWRVMAGRSAPRVATGVDFEMLDLITYGTHGILLWATVQRRIRMRVQNNDTFGTGETSCPCLP